MVVSLNGEIIKETKLDSVYDLLGFNEDGTLFAFNKYQAFSFTWISINIILTLIKFNFKIIKFFKYKEILINYLILHSSEINTI